MQEIILEGLYFLKKAMSQAVSEAVSWIFLLLPVP